MVECWLEVPPYQHSLLVGQHCSVVYGYVCMFLHISRMFFHKENMNGSSSLNNAAVHKKEMVVVFKKMTAADSKIEKNELHAHAREKYTSFPWEGFSIVSTVC